MERDVALDREETGADNDVGFPVQARGDDSWDLIRVVLAIAVEQDQDFGVMFSRVGKEGSDCGSLASVVLVPYNDRSCPARAKRGHIGRTIVDDDDGRRMAK